MTLTKDFFDVTKKHHNEYGENVIVLMQNGAFYEVYGLKDDTDTIFGSNIVDFGRICDLNVVNKKMYIDGAQVVNAGFKVEFLDKFLKKLQDAGYTIAVYDQDEQCPNTTRSLSGIYSPGTYFSNDIENITNNTCCIWLEVKKGTSKNRDKLMIYVGSSVIDIYTGKTAMMEYNDFYIKNPTTFDELEHFISIYNPSESIIISNLTNSDINDIIGYSNIRSKSCHIVNLLDDNVNNKNNQRALNCEKQIYQSKLLSNFYNPSNPETFAEFFNQHVWATQSFCYLLDFIYQHNPHLVHKITEPTMESVSKRLTLANHSLKQLNIIEENDKDYRGKYSSVLKMLNECITPMGKRTFSHNFLNPTTDDIELQKEYDIIEYILSNMSDYKTIKNLLITIKDISKINRQIMLQNISPKSIYQLYTNLLTCKEIYNFVINKEAIVNYMQEKIPEFYNLFNEINEISQHINDIFLIDECKDIDNIQKVEKSFIQRNVDLELDNKINILTNSQDQLQSCRTYLSSVISNYETNNKSKKNVKKKKSVQNEYDEDDDDNNEEKSVEYVKIHETEKMNFSLVATDRRCKILHEVFSKSPKPSVILNYKSSFDNNDKEFLLEIGNAIEYNKQTANGNSKYITSPQIEKLCKNVGTIKVNLIDTITKVYNKILVNLDHYQCHLEHICNFITYIDVIYTKAHIANKYNYCKPIIKNTKNGDSFVSIQGLRHCLIEKIQQTELYVTNDITIGDGNVNGILLYGTNAVGKTSFIRALGISVVMAQAGLYVPATNFIYNPYKYIFTRILGNDNLFKGLSTFAVEMSELRTILRLSDKNSLVLGDELCSGTESISAVSIFVAGIQELHKKNCSFVFATHLHEIINYDEITTLKSVVLKHMSVIYDKERDILIYDRKLKDGPGNNMYGLEVCKSLSLPSDFLENAHNIRMKYHPTSASILDQKTSHYNAKHIMGICEKCKNNIATEVHHLQHQQDANKQGIIETNNMVFHKNHPANLLSLCDKCHDDIHKTGKKHKKIKSTKGNILIEIS
jgi:DNA mismatch repair protein MutS